MQKVSPRRFLVPLIALWMFSLAACGPSAGPAETPTSAQPAEPTVSPTATPTPVPAILQIPLQDYRAANDLFSIQAPETWQPYDDGGGVRFQDSDDPYVSLFAFYFPLPQGTDPQRFQEEEAQRTLSRARLNDPNSLEVLTHEWDDAGHLHLEAVGKFFNDQPPQHMRAETWVTNGVLLGLSLVAPVEKWPDIAPLWPVVRQSYQVLQPDPTAATGLAYVHPGGLFTITVPLYWGVIDEDYDGVLLGDMQGLAQFSVGVEELDHYPTAKELDDTLTNLLGDTPQSDGYLELKRETDRAHERMVQFEAATPDDGIFRTELRVFSDRNLLITTSFSAPPHDWVFFAPDYALLLDSIQTRGIASPDEQTQDADPLAGIEVGVPMFYLDRQGRLQVSAPIRNFRTRNITRLTASIKLYDQSGKFLAAESWRMLQQRLGQGQTTYLYLSLPPATTDLKRVAAVKIQLIDAKDTTRVPYPSWKYQSGDASINSKGDVVIRATLQNMGPKVQKYIFVAAVLYDEQGDLSFVKTERQRLRYATPPGQDVTVKIVIPGPIEHLGAFDVMGERPLLD